MSPQVLNRIFRRHALVEVLLLGVGSGADTLQLGGELLQLAGDGVTEGLAGGYALLQFMGCTLVVVSDEQPCEGESVAHAKLLLPLVHDGATEQGRLGTRLIGEVGQLGVEIAIMVAGEELSIYADGLLAFAHDDIYHGHVALVVLVARMAPHGLLQKGHHLQGT